MLDLKQLVADPQKYKNSFSSRGGDPSEIDRVLAVNELRRKKIQESETLKSEQNKMNDQIAALKKNKQDATKLLEDMKSVSQNVKRLEAEASQIDNEVKDLLLRFPNYLHSSVPVGHDAEANIQVRKLGEARRFEFKPKEHWQIGEELQILDFERAGRVTGARFTFLKAHGARLERALINFMLDIHIQEHGYTEMIPPFMVNTASMTGTGQLPKFGEDLFHLKNAEYMLIPTAEVPVTNYYREETLNEADLPIAFAAYSPCFRAEAGSYGKDTKGLIRQHQFN
jgi:seryl-tRNA synthetase